MTHIRRILIGVLVQYKCSLHGSIENSDPSPVRTTKNVSTQKKSTYCLYHRQREGGGQDSLSAKVTLLLKVLLVLSFIFVDPRHTGHFLVTSWHCQTLKHRKGESTVHLHVLHFYTCGIFRN